MLPLPGFIEANQSIAVERCSGGFKCFSLDRERILYMSVRVAVAQLRPGRSVAELTERS